MKAAFLTHYKLCAENYVNAAHVDYIAKNVINDCDRYLSVVFFFLKKWQRSRVLSFCLYGLVNWNNSNLGDQFNLLLGFSIMVANSVKNYKMINKKKKVSNLKLIEFTIIALQWTLMKCQ